MDSNKMNLKIISHKIIIETITIEEEGIKIIVATKVDEKVTIATTIMGRNNLTTGRELNKKTIRDAYPLSNIADIMEQLGCATYISIFDIASGFQQIPMAPEDCYKTAFTTINGHYEYTRMPEGLNNATATFQRLIKDLQEQESRIKNLMQRLKEAKLVLQPDKIEFFRNEVGFLGHIISARGVEPNPEKVAAIAKLATPKSAKNIREVLGMFGYYRQYIKDFSKIAKPLNDLLKKMLSLSGPKNAKIALKN
ncbi:hypothetical protein TSAR_010477 [Trichomalopsis sarcophagae]|uniref:Reverse transcriptase domain-containing protein n=1 Tax=Trichomalopsis sarcophagae TaxID=543379 RepID=A0A232EHN1_9HYME|nr:hypothetical protein TSAR_010477 [Trichomalopsis sarcophagae]